MTALRPLAALAVAASIFGCARPDQADEEKALMETSRAWSRAAASGDVEAILSYWADSPIVIQPGQPVMRDRAALRAYLEQSMKTPGFRIGWEPLEAEVSGDMGYLIERTEVTVNGPDGRPLTQHFRAVTVWRKQADGSWKNVVDISNAGPAASAPAPGTG